MFYSDARFAAVSAPLVRRMYGGAFGGIELYAREAEPEAGVQSCYDATSPEEVVVHEATKGSAYVYECLATAMRRHGGNYTGFLMLHDDLVLNFWNLRHRRRDAVWLPDDASSSSSVGSLVGPPLPGLLAVINKAFWDFSFTNYDGVLLE